MKLKNHWRWQMIVQLIIFASSWAIIEFSGEIFQKIQEEVVMINGDYVNIVAIGLAALIVISIFNKYRKIISEVEIWKKASKFFREIWNNKILSLFYLIVAGANAFKFSKEVVGIDSAAVRLLIASVVPVTFFVALVFLVVWALGFFGHTRFVRVIKRSASEFFEILDDDSHEEIVSSVRMTLKERAKYIVMDYWATLGCIGVVSLSNYFHLSDVGITGNTIMYDFLVALGFMVYSVRTGKDVTFGRGDRRAIDVIHQESKIIGWIGMFLLNAKATIWDGPEQIPIYFEKELVTYERMVEVLFPLAVIQGLFWAWLYSYGYESIFEAIRAI